MDKMSFRDNEELSDKYNTAVLFEKVVVGSWQKGVHDEKLVEGTKTRVEGFVDE